MYPPGKNRKDLREDSGQVKTENEGMIRCRGGGEIG